MINCRDCIHFETCDYSGLETECDKFREEINTMTIKKARDTGFIGSFTPVMVYDIRDDGYLLTTPVMMRSLSHEWDHFEIVHLEAETDSHWDQPYLCIDIRRE